MASDPFRWVPGRGPDLDAIARLRQAFPKPTQPMGEAWFMGGERYTFDRFAALPIRAIPIEEFGSFLFDIASGIGSFGKLAEWTDWFGYALPDLILRSHETFAFHTLLEPTISAFVNVFGDDASYERRFANDIAITLGRCLMKPELWVDQRTPLLGRALGIRGTSQPVVFWGQTSGDFSAAMFLALRVFPLDALPDFLDSVFAIDHAAWRARVATWLWGATRLLRHPPRTIRELEACNPSIEWENAHCIVPREPAGQPLLSPERCHVALQHLRESLAPQLLDWTFEELPEVAEVMKSLDATGAAFDAILT